jgi:osmotically-inducible protein OsmY
MLPVQITEINPEEFSRCEEREQIPEPGKRLSAAQKTDAAIKDTVSHALWKDDVLRAIEYEQIDVDVKNGAVYLSGHIVNTGSRNRIEKAIRAIPGIQGFRNNLVLDDHLTNQVASSLGVLEHTYDCKFFTGVSHGLVSLDGIVTDESIKLLAEKCASDNPNVRGVINHVRISGGKLGSPDQPFLQPIIGETIYFLDGLSGMVKQVVINPNNRRVIAMTVQGRFVDQQQELKSLNTGGIQSPDRLLVISMDLVRFLTRDSGFLRISSNEQAGDLDFNPASFITPNVDWTPPYPYCLKDILFPVEKQPVNTSDPFPFEEMAEGLSFKKQVFTNDSLGG